MADQSNEMGERVAAAMEEVPEWPAKTYRARTARAAIEAMTEPAPNMLEDMRHEIATTMGITLPDYALIAAWKMAVLAALSHDEVKV